MSNIHESLDQPKICVEKMLPHETHIIPILKKQSNSSHHFKKLKAAFFTSKIWPLNSKIVISFVGDGRDVKWSDIGKIRYEMTKSNVKKPMLDKLAKSVRNMNVIDAVKKIVTERIMPIVNLNIRFADKGEIGNVRVGFEKGKGSWSLIGTDHLHSNADTTINYGWLDIATIIHEFGHMLGLIHEHQNPKQDDGMLGLIDEHQNPKQDDGTHGIKWSKKALYEWTRDTQGWNKDTTDVNIINKYSTDQINGSVFDPESIMLYFFPAKVTLNNKGTYANIILSKKDVIFLNNIYQGSTSSPAQFYEAAYDRKIDGTDDNTDDGTDDNTDDGTDDNTDDNTDDSDTGGIYLFTIAILVSIIVVYFLVKSLYDRYTK
jgi:hypothetical protein